MQAVRALFTKTGMVRYISHLDLQRTMTRAFLRSGLDMRYSEGFNPHVRVTFALPLSVGTSSECEMVDFWIMDEQKYEDIPKIINRVLPNGIEIKEAYQPVTQFKDIDTACYTIEAEGDLPTAEQVKALFEKPVILRKRTKSGEKDTDIQPDIHSIETKRLSDSLRIDVVLSANPANYLNPTYIIKALEQHLGAEVTRSGITRREVLTRSGGRFR